MKKRIFALVLGALLCLPCAAFAARYASVRLVAESYALGGGQIEAGIGNTLKVVIRNTNAYSSAGNIVFTVTDPQGRIIPQGPSGVYVNEIPRGGEAEIGFALMAMPDAQPGYAKLVLSAEYENGEGQRETMSADLYVEITQPVRLEHGIAALPPKVTEGDNAAFALDFFNMGKGTVYNVLMAFDVPGLNGGSAVLVGNVEPGETKTGRANLLVSEPGSGFGETEGTLSLTWENAAGELSTEQLALSTVVAPKPVIAPASQEQQEQQPLFPAWLPGAAIALCGTAAVICIQISIERRRRRERDEKML